MIPSTAELMNDFSAWASAAATAAVAAAKAASRPGSVFRGAVAAIDQLLVRVVFGLALLQERLGLPDHRLAALVGYLGDELARPDGVAALGLQFDDDAGDPRRCPGAPVSLRRARQDDLLLMLLGHRRGDADPLHGVGGRRFRREQQAAAGCSAFGASWPV